jgi:hypothetical protein
MSLLCFSICYIPLDRDEEVKSSFVGPLPRDCCSTLNPSITSLFLMILLSFIRVFGRIKFP